MKNLIGVGIADSAEQRRVRQCTLESVVFTEQTRSEFIVRALERLETSAIDRRALLSRSTLARKQVEADRSERLPAVAHDHGAGDVLRGS